MRWTQRGSLLIGIIMALGPALVSLPAAAAPTGQSGPAGGQSVPDEIIIQYKDKVFKAELGRDVDVDEAEEDDARSKVGAVRQERLRDRSGRSKGDLELVKVPAGKKVDDAIRTLKGHRAVEYAEPNWIYTHQVISNDPESGSLWGMQGDATIPANQYGSQAAEAWAAGKTGSSNVYVGVIDEGLQFDHEDLKANVWTNDKDPENGTDDDHNGVVDDLHGWDFFQNNNSIYDGTTDDHGTHVSGTIGAQGGNDVGVAGVNWSVKLISAKFLGPSGGTTANAVKAVDYLTDLKTRHNLNIVATSNSWGGGGYSQALHDAIIRAAKADILFVAAAGNDTRNNDTTANYPSNYNTTDKTSTETAASYDAVIAVAAIDSQGSKASWSNYGATTVDLGAPGVSIKSTLPDTYGDYSGTSMATPHVSGAAALYASEHTNATALEIKTAILTSAIPTASLAGKTVTGGRLNVCGMLALGSTICGVTPAVPTAPSGLTAMAVSRRQVNLAWTDKSSNEDGFKIERCTGSSCTNFSQIKTVGANVTTYSNTGLSRNTTYTYRVRANNAAGDSGYSNTFTVKTQN